MSPEQATGSQLVDRRTDVRSLGCVLCHPPYPDVTSPAAVLAWVVTEDPPPVSRDRPAGLGGKPEIEASLAAG